MTAIQLDDSVVAALTMQACAQGLSLEDYLKSLAAHVKRLTAAEVIGRIRAAAVPSASTYRGTYPREDIYADHD
jgi:hypothetical protein